MLFQYTHYYYVDDHNRIVLKPTGGYKRTFINACYIEVRLWTILLLSYYTILKHTGIFTPS